MVGRHVATEVEAGRQRNDGVEGDETSRQARIEHAWRTLAEYFVAEIDRVDHGSTESVSLVGVKGASGLAPGHHARLERERDEPLLHAVVQVAFQTAARPVL